nr:ribonuclease H-like domain-containing protein [Tanacetum cinerariifolium]
MNKAFPLLVRKFPLPEGTSHCLKKNATARKKVSPLPEVCTAIIVKEKPDSYKVPTTNDPNNTTTKKDDEQYGRNVTITTEDMQRKKNDVKARTTLLLSLPDEHQLRFSKYKTAKELWAVILKTFGGNEATKKRKKNLLKQQYGKFKADGLETLEQTFNRLQVIRNRNDLDTMSLDDLYNHLKVYEAEVQKKSNPNSQNMAFISSSKHNSGDEDSNTACVSTSSTTFPTASASVAIISQDTASAYIASQSNGSQIKFEDINQIDEDDMEEIDIKWSMALNGAWRSSKNLDNLIESQRFDKVKDVVGYNAVPPPPADLYLSSKKDLSWTGLPEFGDDTFTDYSRPSPTVASTSAEGQNKNSTNSEDVASPNTPKPFVKFVKPKDNQSKMKTQYRAPWVPTVNKNNSPVNRKFSTGRRNFPTVNRKFLTASRKFTTGSIKIHTADMGRKGKAGSSQNNIDDKGYWNSGCSRYMTGNISYLSDFEPFDGGYVSFGQG